VPNPQALALQHSTTHVPSRHSVREDLPVQSEPLTPAISTNPTSPNSASRNGTPSQDPVDKSVVSTTEAPLLDYPIRCNLVVHQLKDGYAARANTLGTYFKLNQQCLRSAATTAPTSDMIDSKAQISPDSIIGPSTRIGERTTIKKCVIGKHCVIGKNVRLSGSVLMDHVEVLDGAKIENCIVSQNARIGERAQLRDCQLQAGWMVPDDGMHKGEQLKRFQVYEEEE